ncbi:MAG: Maf family nucleotide pyrophosphatase [Cellvibrionaceae bacterium]|nr:Maf family nucleotide pyrophosphatase [Cellvibrionaceae bacterium]
MSPPNRNLILASSSAYRRQLLSQLGLSFTYISPNIDELPLANESAMALTKRLALAKAQRILRDNPEALVIGSDQVADLDGIILGKPHTAERAFAQLKHCSGRTVHFFTAVALTSSQHQQSEVVTTQVRFRTLSDSQLLAYIKKEEPLDCAGSFKCEGLGIALFESITSDDPSALIGLPLIRLAHMLGAEGIEVLTA